ncbi:hypothetical protein LCI18_002684 [Fusarium solani-melongenae]|uniref:Uncharacterized protein n=1 Tax=Fusarium solani subsp. cucurbitae TaxID=2747967 RepID=A0ACD3YS38_FUSSC|nr:hypothetical protein LCI18_002684 [Fusarium solani-melongenae]
MNTDHTFCTSYPCKPGRCSRLRHFQPTPPTTPSCNGVYPVIAARFTVDEAKAQVEEHGFYVIEDTTIGSRVDEMIQKDYRFNLSEETGFNFWRDVVLSSPYIQGILSAFESDGGVRYVLTDRGSLFPDPSHIKTLRYGGKQPDILAVQVWPRGSTAIYYRRSHRAKLKRFKTPTGAWEVVAKELRVLECPGERIDFDQGGMVIFGTRIAIDMIQGRSYYYSYFTEDMCRKFKPLVPPPSQDVDEVAKLGLHVQREEFQTQVTRE